MKKKIAILLALVMVFGSFYSLSAVALNTAKVWVSEKPHYEGDYAYSFALVPDTQILAAYDAETVFPSGSMREADKGQGYMKNLYKWIVDNKESKKIEYVFGLGDITQNSDWIKTNYPDAFTGRNYEQIVADEWNVAKEAIYQLDAANIPYSMVRGNHDRLSNFNAAFNTNYYKGYHTFMNSNNLSNSYSTMKIGEVDYLFLNLDFEPTDAMLTWAGNVVSSHPNHKVIVTTHGYMNSDRTYLTTYGGSDDRDGNPGSQIWSKFTSKYSNIFMVLCGHIGYFCPQITTATGANGNTVYQVLANGQDDDSVNEIKGYVTMLYFSKDGSTFWVEYYSTAQEEWFDLTYEDPSLTYSNYQYEYIYDESKLNFRTNWTASTRISTVKSGLRFKSLMKKTFLEELKTNNPNATISVGTLIMPADMLGDKQLTHDIGVENVDYIDVRADVNNPFGEDTKNIIYAGSVVGIKNENLKRDFVGRGYVKVSELGKADVYYYSDVSSTRNINQVATSALADLSDTQSEAYPYLTEDGKYSPYTDKQRAMIEIFAKLTEVKDPHKNDIFG